MESGFNRTLCGSTWDSLSSTNGLSATGRLGCCAAGKFMSKQQLDPFVASTACANCPAGKYSTSNNAYSSCIDCIPGTYGYISGLTNVTLCTSCTRGKFSIESGLSELSQCKFCPVGWQQSIPRQSACLRCAKGQYGDREGIISEFHTDTEEPKCKACPQGKYTDETSRFLLSHCKLCEVGKYGDTVAVEIFNGCKNCSAGRWLNLEGKTSDTECSACGPGKYGTETSCFAADGTNQDSSQTYAQRDGLATWSCTDSCRPCPLGRYSIEKGAPNINACLLCPTGQYLDQVQKTEITHCKDCPAGRFGVLTGLISARTLSVPARQRCQTCPAGKYNSELGSNNVDSCKSCSLGFWLDTNNDVSSANNVASVQCKECPTGRYGNRTGLIAKDSSTGVGLYYLSRTCFNSSELNTTRYGQERYENPLLSAGEVQCCSLDGTVAYRKKTIATNTSICLSGSSNATSMKT